MGGEMEERKVFDELENVANILASTFNIAKEDFETLRYNIVKFSIATSKSFNQILEDFKSLLLINDTYHSKMSDLPQLLNSDKPKSYYNHSLNRRGRRDNIFRSKMVHHMEANRHKSFF